jgi:DNA modification methylase
MYGGVPEPLHLPERLGGVVTPYYEDESVTLLHGDPRKGTGIPDNSVDCIVTSPPYWGLRDYGGEPDQIGLEETPEEYVEALRIVFAECARVLKDAGTCWLNLGDTYAKDSASGPQGKTGQRADRRFTAAARATEAVPPKNLLGLPWRVAFALQADGWFIRAENIWAKRNIMPEAVTDRTTRAHEQIFMLTRSPRYFYDADAIREESDPEQEAHNQRYAKEYAEHSRKVPTRGQPGNVNSLGIHSRPGKGGRNARSVWTISSTPSRHDHFASFPVEIPRRCIAAGCPEGGVVLDPFSGTGTTGEAARRLGRRYIGIDTHAPYLDIQVGRFAQGVLL